jgi:hypothetical protein
MRRAGDGRLKGYKRIAQVHNNIHTDHGIPADR